LEGSGLPFSALLASKLNEEFVLETHTRLRREIPLLVGILVDEFFFHVVTVGVMWESKLMMAAWVGYMIMQDRGFPRLKRLE
jgi:hypothetical protein